MEAVILAGGFGTRLQSVVKNLPKPMADINSKPFLKYLFDYLVDNSITSVIICVGYKKEYIMNYFGDSYKNISIKYSEEDEPLGTGGAIKKALTLCKEENIFVLNGDTFFKINLNKLLDEHTAFKNHLTLSLKKMYNFDRYGSVTLHNHKVQSFNEKCFLSEGLINGGTYLMNRNILLNYPEVFSFEQEVLEKKSKIQIGALEYEDYFIDIGIPEDYQKAKEYFGLV